MIPGNMVTKDRLEFDPIIPEDERRFYQKAYLNVNLVRERKVHCTVCKMHIGTAPSNESIIRMHPILRVTHCKKCHEFYNSGEFSKGEDGSELYCRWCGQGGEVYCCSNCPFVFCKSCIISNLSRGVVADIEQNENWSCFNCAPKMLWPLRAQHWALMKFIDKQKKAILNSSLSDAEIKTQMTKDRSLCCKVKKTGYGTDSSESSDISLSKLKQKPGEKRSRKSMSKEDLSCRMSPALPKKAKPNDEVVCTPDVMSMLEPECQLTVAPNAKTNQQPTASSPKILSIPQPTKRNTPPPLVIRNAQAQQVRAVGPSPVVKKTIVGPRLPATTGGDFSTPVYHTINGYRIDLNSAAQQETVRLPNGKLIQVKRQGTGPQTVTTVQSAPNQQGTPARVIHSAVSPSFPNQQIVHSSGGHIIRAQLQTPRSITVQNSVIPQFQQQTPQQFQQITIRQPNQPIATIRYQGASNPQVTNIIQNGTVQLLNGAAVTTSSGQVAAVRQVPTFIKQLFPNTPLGLTRNQLQNQICSAMEICQHLMNKVQTLTNSNAYKTAKSLTDVKELYIHLSYLLTYAIGRFKGLQDNCLSDMRDLGFTTDANSLENGQLAADKQASDAEEDEITIVEPKTDTITLDSDNEEDSPTSVQRTSGAQQSVIKSHSNSNSSTIGNSVHASLSNQSSLITPTTTTNENNEITTQYDFSNIFGGMLDIDMTELGNNGVPQPKKPRKKTTNKPNPTLLKQKEIQERERLENLKKNDAKLKMQVQIPLNKVEEIYQYAKPLVDELKCEKLDEKSEVKEDIEVVSQEGKAEGNADITVKSNTVKNEEIEVKKKNEVESNTDDKDEPEEVVVVVVEDLDNSKEDEGSKNDVEDNEESVEIIEHEESQDPDEDQSKEDSQLSEITPEDNEVEKEVEVEKPIEKENEKSKEQKETEKDKSKEQKEIEKDLSKQQKEMEKDKSKEEKEIEKDKSKEQKEIEKDKSKEQKEIEKDKSKEQKEIEKDKNKEQKEIDKDKNKEQKEMEKDKSKEQKEIEKDKEKEENCKTYGKVSKVSETITKKTKDHDKSFPKTQETSSASVKATNEAGCKEDKKKAVNIDGNTLQNESKSTIVLPIENHCLEKETEDGVSSSHSSHTLNFKSILTRTGAL